MAKATFSIDENDENNDDILSDSPIENAGDIPIFEDADKRGLRTCAYLKVIKLDNPGSGYKGQVPVNSTLETIAQLHGDGIYNIEACNIKHRVLRSKENVRISLAEEKKSNGQADFRDQHIAALITGTQRAHEREMERVEKSNDKVTEQVRNQGQEFVSLVKTTTEGAIQRDREYFKGVNEQQQAWFANMMQANAQMFQQTMAMVITGHQQTMESIKALNERETQLNNPMVMIALLMEGLKLGRDMSDDDTPDWLKALGIGKEMFSDFSNTWIKTKQLPNSSSESPKNKNKSEKEKPLTKEELIKIIELKRILRTNGIDLKEATEDTIERFKELNSSDSNEDLEESEEKSKDSSDDKGKTNLES